MSGSYWDSSQRHKWKYTRESLAKEKQKLWLMECQLFPHGLNITIHDSKTNKQVVTNIPVTQRDLHYDRDYNLRIYCYFLIMKLGRRLNIRQCALVTAYVYLSRFLLRASVREVNLYLLITTCIYLACKVEECPQHIRTLVNEARSLWPEFIPPDVTKVTEFEFYLIEELQSYLIVHHPYRSLEQIERALASSSYDYKLSDDELQKIWSLVNDSYITDVHLLYSPHVIAISCLFAVTCIIHKSDEDSKRDKINKFIAETQVNLEQVMVIVQELISLYDHWDKYNELRIRALLHELYLRQQPSQAQLSLNQ